MADDQRRITVKIVGDSKEFELSLTKAQLRMVEARGKAAQLAESLKKQADAANNAAKANKNHADATAHGVSSMQASSAALRLVEGGFTNNIRAAERFLGTIPGLTNALKAAFPIVGAVALIGVFTEMFEHAQKVKKAFDDMRDAPSRVAGEFNSIIAANVQVIDGLDVTNAKLQESIDKIQHKPNNGLALAIAEAKKQADELSIAIDSNITKIEEVLKKEEIGSFSLSHIFEGKATDTDVTEFAQRMRQVGAQVHEQLLDQELDVESAKYKSPEDLDKARAAFTIGETNTNAKMVMGQREAVEALLQDARNKQNARNQYLKADYEAKSGVYDPDKAAKLEELQQRRFPSLSYNKESRGVDKSYQTGFDTIEDQTSRIQKLTDLANSLKAITLEGIKGTQNLTKEAQLKALEKAKAQADAYKGVRDELTQLSDKLKGVSEITKASTPLEQAHAKAFAESKEKIDRLNESLREHGLSVKAEDAARIRSLDDQIAVAELEKKTNEEFKKTVAGIREKVESYQRLTAALNATYEVQRAMFIQDELEKASRDKNFNPSQAGALKAGFGYQFDQAANAKVGESINKTEDHTAILNAEANAALKGAAAVREQALAEKIANETHGKSAEQIAAITKALTDEANAQERLKTDQMIQRLQQETAAQERLNAARLRGADAVRQAQLANQIENIKATTQAGPDQDKLIAATVAQAQLQEQTRILDLATQIDFQEKSKLEDLDKEIAKMKEIGASAYAIKEVEKERQEILDKVALQSGSLSDVMRATADRMAASAQNVRQQISDAMIALQDGINDNITKLALGEKTDWGKMFKSEGGSLLKTGLKDVEGQVLGKFGLSAGKRDGSSASSALYVQLANGQSTGLGGLFKGGSSGSGASSGGGLFGGGDSGGGIFSALGSGIKSAASSIDNFFGGFAEGGDIPSSGYAMVGENGPELVKTGSAGAHVIPNHALGGTSVTHIDARGTDPVLVEARIKAASRQTYKASAATSQKQLTDMSNRRSR